MERMLFIGHEASRTGAPSLLLHFLQWLRDRGEASRIDLLLLQGGELEEEFRKVANVRLLPVEQPRRRRRGIKRLGEKIGLVPRHAEPVAPFAGDYDLVVGNTIIALPQLARFQGRGLPTVAWLHELDYVVGAFSTERFVDLSRHVDRFLVVSQAVADMLRRLGIQKGIDVAHGFPKLARPDPEGAAAVRKQLGIPPDAFVVGGCGTIEWRKGVDLFLQLARRLVPRHDDIYFLWVGGGSPHAQEESRRIRHDFERLDVAGRMVFAGAQARAQPFLSAMDVFGLTSREDPFPLVCLEAAGMGKPLVCFEKSGGTPEFIGLDAGAIVPYGDLDAFSEELLFYRNNPTEARRAGKAAREKVESSFSMESACARLWGALQEVAKAGAGRSQARAPGQSSPFDLRPSI